MDNSAEAVCFAAVTLLGRAMQGLKFCLRALFFATGTYRRRTAGGSPIVFMPYVGTLELLHKNRQKFPHFFSIFTGGKKCHVLAKISIPLLFRAPPFRTMVFFRNSEKLVKDRWWAYLTVPTGWGWVPPTLRSVGGKGAPQGKVG